MTPTDLERLAALLDDPEGHTVAIWAMLGMNHLRPLLAHVRALEEANQDAHQALNQTRAQLRAYTNTVVMRPHKWMALRDADDTIPLPEPESLTAILDDLARAEARARALEEANVYLAECVTNLHKEREATPPDGAAAAERVLKDLAVVTLVIRVTESLNDRLVQYCVETDTVPSNVLAVALSRFLESRGR